MKVKFKVKNLSAVHTGADEKSGTLTKFRKKKMKLELEQAESKFATKTEQRKVFMSLLLEVYKSIDLKLKRKYYGYYDALKGNLLAAAGRRTKWEFLDTLLTKSGIKSLNNNIAIDVLRKFGDIELSMFVKSEIQLIIAMLRINVQEKREWWKQLEQLKSRVLELESEIDKLDDNLSDFIGQNAKLNDEHVRVLDEINNTFSIKDVIVVESDEKPKYDTSVVEVPQIKANSVTGLMRDLLMNDFLLRIGAIQRMDSEIESSLYHMMTTGGVITESTAYEDIEYREHFIKMFPPIGVLGTAAGSMTFESGIGVSDVELCCFENETGETRCSELLDIVFSTRRDDSKTEMNIRVKGESKSKTAQQMIMYRECVIQGAVWDIEFGFNIYSPLIKSCAWHGWQLMKQHGKIGGRTNRGFGKVDYQIDIPKGATDLYLNHIEKNKKEMFDYFITKRVVNASA